MANNDTQISNHFLKTAIICPVAATAAPDNCRLVCKSYFPVPDGPFYASIIVITDTIALITSYAIANFFLLTVTLVLANDSLLLATVSLILPFV